MKKLILCICILSSAVLTHHSCIPFHLYDGWPELVSVRDTMLNDSCIIYGYARNIDIDFVPMTFDVSIENTNLRTSTDTAGFYYIKTLPGVLSVSCEMQGNDYEELKETLRFEAPGNKKIRVDFHIGYTIE